MSLTGEIKLVIDQYKKHKSTLEHNAVLTDIYEGNLLPYVEKDLKCQLNEKAYERAKHRIAPINLLPKIMDKLSAIFNPPPVRRIVDGIDADQALLDWYVKVLNANELFARSCLHYNMSKVRNLQFFVDSDQMPGVRLVQPDSYFVFSTDKVNSMRATHMVLVDFEVQDGQPVEVFYVFTKDEFLVFDIKENIHLDKMVQLDNPQFQNFMATLPFTYETASDNHLYPNPDTDILKMTKLVPVMLSDLNYAVMFQCFSIIYTVGVQDADISFAPNALWALKKDGEFEGDPKVDIIKPTVDYDGVLGLVQSELSLWLNSKGIRPGAIGKMDGDNFANGISKIIDEMDTFEYRNELIASTTRFEERFWLKLMHEVVPFWVSRGLISNKAMFSRTARIEITYGIQSPMTSRTALITELKLEMENKLTTRRRALEKLNPMLSEKEIDDLIAEINAESAPKPVEFQAPVVEETEV